MKLIRSKTAIIAFVFTAVLCGAGHAESPAVRNCTWCHGSSAQGYTPAPRLAGQRAGYLQRQIADFRTHARNNPFSKQYMWAASENLSRQRVHDLATYFASLNPEPANDGNKQSTALGRTIYFEGMPEANIVACIACHGPNAEGVGQIPRLGGLAYTYLKRRLTQWGEGYHSAAKAPMPRIASRLSTSQVDALASYLSFVK